MSEIGSGSTHASEKEFTEFKISVKKNSIIEKLNKNINNILEENMTLKDYIFIYLSQSGKFGSFNGKFSVSISDYLYKVKELTGVEDNTLIISFIYLNRICDKASIILSQLNLHKFLFISIIFAIKYNEDIIYSQKLYSDIFDISLKEIRILEEEYVDLIDFNFYVSKKEFLKYKKYLEMLIID